MLMRHQWIRAAREAALDQVLRGNRAATPQELASLVALALKKGAVPIRLGGVPIPPSDETRHLLMVGKSGSGKTTALRGLVRQIIARGEHMLIFDPDSSYIATFYDPARGDIILNVWDARSARWNPFDDIANIDDAYRVASILVPQPSTSGDNAIWYEQVRAVVANIMHRLLREGRTSLDDLASTLTSATTDEIRALVARTEAARALEPGAEKATASVMFMMTGAARIATMLASVPSTAPTFSFDRFYATLANRTGPKPLVFLAAPRRYREAGAPLVTAWIDAAASAILQRQIDTAPKAWLVLDEMASLPPINSLLTLFPEGRKYGAAIVIAFQSVAQLQQRYGPDGVHVLTGQTASQLIMGVGDHPTAKWAVDLVGTVEVQNQRATESLDGSAKGERGSLAMHRDRNTLVLDSEVTGLATGEAYLRLSSFPLAKVVIDQGTPMPPIAEGWIPAPVVITVPPAGDHIPTPAPASRIENRDDWLFAGDPS